jgi:ATP-dependent DNA ligase
MLPINLEYEPMEALLSDKLPTGEEWQYEPKWDGFRCLVFRDGDSIALRSKSGRILERYFPEIESYVRELAPKKFVLDGEIVIPTEDGFSFDLLLQRIHPAESRIKKLAKETPGVLILFDILVDEEGESLLDQPLELRREKLAQFGAAHLQNKKQITLSPASTNIEDAEKWRELFQNKLDGIVAKRLDLPYQSGNRKGMVKYKWIRTADCVIGGFRYGADSAKTVSGDKSVGSLLLGLYDQNGSLNHVGFCSSFTAKEKKELAKKLEPLIQKPGFTGATPGGPSRWSKGEEKEWFPLGGGLVAEFSYDHFSDGRFRHGTKLLRWRPDKDARQCTQEQIK